MKGFVMKRWTLEFGFALTLLACAAAFGGEIERSFAVDTAPEVSIYNKKGSLTIIGWDQPQIRITGTVGNDVTEVSIDDDAENPEIEVRSSKWSSSAAEAKLTVYVPMGSSLDVETVSASIEVSGVSGETMNLETTSGSIKAESAFNEVDVEGVSGSIELSGATGEVSISSVSGKVDVQGDVKQLEIESVSGGIDTDVRARAVSVESVSGSIRLGVRGAGEVSGESVSGSIRYEGTLAPDGELDLHVLSGGITVEFAEPAFGEYRLSTFSGSVKCELEPLKSLQKDRKQMQFDFGDGGCDIDIESFSGSITVR